MLRLPLSRPLVRAALCEQNGSGGGKRNPISCIVFTPLPRGPGDPKYTFWKPEGYDQAAAAKLEPHLGNSPPMDALYCHCCTSLRGRVCVHGVVEIRVFGSPPAGLNNGISRNRTAVVLAVVH